MTADPLRVLKDACALIQFDDGRATGVVIAQGRVLTAPYLLQSLAMTSPPRVRLRGREYAAVTRGINPDLALGELEVPDFPNDLKPVEVGGGCSQGDAWFVYGFPAAAGHTGVWLMGTILDPSGEDSIGGSAVVLGMSSQTFDLRGLAGGPVFVGGKVVAVVHTILAGDDSGRPMGGILYAKAIAKNQSGAILRKPTRKSIRSVLERIFFTNDMFDAFCFDHFERVTNEFTPTMTMSAKITILLKAVSADDLLDILGDEYGDQFRAYASELRFEETP
jgi:hypothetical protein